MKLLTGIVCLVLVVLAYSVVWFYMRPTARTVSRVSQHVPNQDILSPFCTSVQKTRAYLSEIDDYIGSSGEGGIAKQQQELLRELVTSHTLICKLISRLIKTGIPENVTVGEPQEKPVPVEMQYSAQQVIPVVRRPLTGWHYGVGHVSKSVPVAPVQIPIQTTAARNRGKYHPKRYVNYKGQPRHPTPKQVCQQKLSYAQVKSHGGDSTLTKMCPSRGQTYYVGAGYKIPPHGQLLIDTDRAGRTPPWRLPPKPQSTPINIVDSVPDKKMEQPVEMKPATESKPHVSQVPIINKTEHHELPSGDDTIWHILFDRLEKITGNIVQLQVQMKDYDVHTYLSRKVSTDLLNELLQRYLKQTDRSKFDKSPQQGDKATITHKAKIVPQKHQKPGNLKTVPPQTTGGGVPPTIQKTSINQQHATNKSKAAAVQTKPTTTGQQQHTSAKAQAAVPQKSPVDNVSSSQTPPSSAKKIPRRERDRVDHILRQGRPRRNVRSLFSWQKWAEKFGSMRKEVGETSTFCASAVGSLEKSQMEACKTRIGMSPGLSFGLATTISISVLASVALGFRLYTKFSQTSKFTSQDTSYHAIDKASKAVPEGNIAIADRQVPALVDSRIKLDLCVLGISSSARDKLEPLIRRVFGSDYKIAESDNSFYTVETFSDMASVPEARMYAIGLELPAENRQHILDDEALGKRSLKFKTVDKLLNTGADVALICIGDPGSQRLPKGKCYNRVAVQYDHNFLVRSLCRNERFFTINKDFTPSQISRLRDWIAKGLATETI